ncbi:MAG: MarC family protein [Oculatellaceae cyanobacterium Prado106]|jgi:multiple antibiotic resistance protein|nr:MarC family protein [Oculatellaceae cyanobacterium Prado106]
MWQLFLSSTLGTFVALFPIANPVGAVPIFYSLTDGESTAYRCRLALWTALNVVWVLIAFFLAGKFILSFFGISLGVLQIAGGLLVSQTAWEMLTVRPRLTSPESQEAADKHDISFTPMAVPLISGPGAIGVVIGISERSGTVMSYLGSLAAIVLLGILLYLMLALGEPLVKKLGSNGVGALNRVLGFFILAIAVQLIANGTFDLIRQSAPGLLR